MSATARCMGSFCSCCSNICNHRVIQCEHCGEPLALRVRGRFPRIGFIDGGNFTFPCSPSQVLRDLENTDFDLFTFLQKPGAEQAKFDHPFELDNLAILPISTFDHWWGRQIGTKARNQVRRSEKKGVEVEETALTEELLEAICDIYNETPIRQGRPFAHYGMDVETARTYAGTFPSRSIFVAARHEGKIVGFSKVVVNTAGDFAAFLHSISMNRHRDKSVNNALIAGMVRACAARGVSQLAYAKFEYGKKRCSSLTDFKINNGFERVLVPRYYITRNLRGTVAFRLGLHHGFSERLPESIASRLRQLRAKYYQAKVAVPAVAE